MKICVIRVLRGAYLEKELSLIQYNNDYVEFQDNSNTEFSVSKEVSDKILLSPVNTLNVDMDGCLFSLLESALKSCYNYRFAFFQFITNIYTQKLIKINVNIIVPKYHIIDTRGNKLFEHSCLERRELDNALAWFSTLGGGFSALGDTIEHCAIMAGKISQQQFLLALRLGDPNLVARCKLYLSLSLIQQKKFSEAKPIIKSQFLIAKKEYERDRRLMSMCLGIWTKWKYDKRHAKLNDRS